MNRGVENRDEGGSKSRPVIYCLLPPELAPKLHDLLREHFRDDPSVEVVVEQRHRERRSGEERRRADGEARAGEERRRIRGPGGRRVGERRGTLIPFDDAPELPRRARRYATQITFVERLEPSTQDVEDQDTARLVTRFQAGNREAFTVLYTRYFDRVYAYLRTALRDAHEAEDATQQVFTQVFEALPRYERRPQPFRGWLFILVRNQAVSRLRRQGRLELEDAEEIERHRELNSEREEMPEALDWLSDRDLMLFVERLPLAQRQVLLLRYVLDFNNRQIGEILGRTPMDIARLHHRAMTYLRGRLGAIGHAPGHRGRRAESRRPITQVAVLRARRFALTSRS